MVANEQVALEFAASPGSPITNNNDATGDKPSKERRVGMKTQSDGTQKTESPGTSGASVNTVEKVNPLPDATNSIGEGTSTVSFSIPQAMASANSNVEFELSRLRLPQDYESEVGVRKILTQVPIDKPGKQTFFRAHPDWSFPTMVLEHEESRETYIVVPQLYHLVANEAVPKVLYLCITRSGDLFFLPIKLPGSDGKIDSWNRSRVAAVEAAKDKWVRMSANQAAAAYDVFVAIGSLPEPEWPNDKPFEDILKVAFRDRIIDSPDHPVLRQLRGEL